MRASLQSAAASHSAAIPLSRRMLPAVTGIVVALLFGLLAILNLLPLVWGILTSLKSQPDIFRFPPTLFDFVPSPENYIRVLGSGFMDNMRASLFYSGATVLGVL